MNGIIKKNIDNIDIAQENRRNFQSSIN